jgi:hypothetical protein
VTDEIQRQLTALYDAFNARQIDTVLEALHPEVDWPNGWEGGWLHGREAVRDYWQRQWKEIDPSVVPTGFQRRAGTHVDVTVRQVVRDRSGAIHFDGTVVHSYEFEDGLVRRMNIRHPPS